MCPLNQGKPEQVLFCFSAAGPLGFPLEQAVFLAECGNTGHLKVFMMALKGKIHP